jgi:hypothetical protein
MHGALTPAGPAADTEAMDANTRSSGHAAAIPGSSLRGGLSGDETQAAHRLGARLARLDGRLDELAALRSAEAVALGVRLRGAEVALGSLEEIEVRVSGIEERLDGLDTLEQRFDTLSRVVARLCEELDALAGRPATEHPVARVPEH